MASKLASSLQDKLLLILYCVLFGSLSGVTVTLINTQDAIGLTGLVVLFFIFICFVYYQPYSELRMLLLISFLVRAALALVHAYIVPLPDSQADAIAFEHIGWELAQGWRAGAPFEFITGAYLYSWVIGLIYFIFDRCPLLIQSLNVFFGSLIVYLTAAISREFFNTRVMVFSSWVACIFPTLLLYSAITMREVAVVFNFALSVLYFARWLKNNRNYVLIKSMLFLFISGLFHTGILLLLTVPLLFWLYRSVGEFLRLRMGTFIFNIFTGILVLGLIAIPFITGMGMEKVGDITRVIDAEYIGARHEIQARDRAAYLTGLDINTWSDLVIAVPLKTIYFLFAPFPWDISAPIDLLGMVDGLIYLGLTLVGLKGVLHVRKQHGKFIFWGLMFILAIGIIIFSMGTGNYGTAIRHRAKFAFLLIAIAGPSLYYLRNRLIAGLIRGSWSSNR